MSYAEMILRARQKGVADESKMWKAIGSIDELLEKVDDVDKEHFLRKQHCELYGPHYDEYYAMHDVNNLEYSDRNGTKRTGGHWTLDEVSNAMSGKPMHSKSNIHDAYVAANVMYSDLCNILDDEAILSVTHEFFFNDTDAPEGKIWRYMSAMR